MHKPLLKLETEEEQAEDSMRWWTKNFEHNILIEHRENMWLKGLTFILCYNLTEIFYKVMYQWILTLGKLSKMYKGISDLSWKCEQHEESF